MGHDIFWPPKTASARAQNSWRESSWQERSRQENSWQEHDPRPGKKIATNTEGDIPAVAISPDGVCPPSAGAGSACISPALKEVSPAPAPTLSIRAENVMKELAVELAGETPPSGRWIPSRNLLRKLSFKDLQTARNCGPQTADEIVRWAGAQGIAIERPFHAGKSLSAVWQDIIARSSRGECTKAEIAEALERSRRRKNTRIPVALQSILVKLLNATGK